MAENRPLTYTEIVQALLALPENGSAVIGGTPVVRGVAEVYKITGNSPFPNTTGGHLSLQYIADEIESRQSRQAPTSTSSSQTPSGTTTSRPPSASPTATQFPTPPATRPPIPPISTTVSSPVATPINPPVATIVAPASTAPTPTSTAPNAPVPTQVPSTGGMGQQPPNRPPTSTTGAAEPDEPERRRQASATHFNINQEDVPPHVRSGGSSVILEWLSRLTGAQATGQGKETLLSHLNRLQEAQTAYYDYLKKGGGRNPQDLEAQALHREVLHRRKGAVGALGEASSAEREAAGPLVQSVDKQKDAINKEILAREKSYKDFEKTGTVMRRLSTAADTFGEALGYSGNIASSLFTAASSALPGGSATAAAIHMAFVIYEREQAGVARGQQALSPALAQEVQNRDLLANMMRARTERVSEAMAARSYRLQLQQQGGREGLPEYADPSRFAGYNLILHPAHTFRNAWSLLLGGAAGIGGGVAGMFSGRGFVSGATQASEEVLIAGLRRRLRERGIQPEAYRPDVPRVPGLAQGMGAGGIAPGILGGGGSSGMLEWLHELQTVHLATPGTEREVIQEQVREQVERTNGLIDRVENLVNNLESRPNFQ